MPELPEVEIVRIGLSKLITGQKILSVWHDWPKSFPNAPSDVKKFIVGAKITAVKRRAKVLLIELDNKYTLLLHLKMTGQLVYRGEQNFGAGHPTESLIGKLPDKSTRVILFLTDKTAVPLESSARKKRGAEQGVDVLQRVSTGVSDTAIDQERWRSFGLRPKAGQRVGQLFFNDQRKFGWMRLLPTVEVPNIDFMKKLGPEPLATDFTAKDFRARLQKRPNSNIKSVLLDQKIIAGVGNIYVDESLWGAKVHPFTLVKNIPAVKSNILFKELRHVLKLSIEKGGSTDRNYVDAEGKKGSYIKFARVFRREGQPCPRCNSTIIKLRVAGRGTHICPKCQRKPK